MSFAINNPQRLICHLTKKQRKNKNHYSNLIGDIKRIWNRNLSGYFYVCKLKSYHEKMLQRSADFTARNTSFKRTYTFLGWNFAQNIWKSIWNAQFLKVHSVIYGSKLLVIHTLDSSIVREISVLCGVVCLLFIFNSVELCVYWWVDRRDKKRWI